MAEISQVSVVNGVPNAGTGDVPTLVPVRNLLTEIRDKIIAAPATQATLASVLAKIISAPATEAKQDAIIAALALLAPAGGAIQVTKSDDTVLTGVRSIKVGGAGTVVATIGGADFTFTCSDGEVLPVRATKVKLASTATNIVALT